MRPCPTTGRGSARGRTVRRTRVMSRRSSGRQSVSRSGAEPGTRQRERMGRRRRRARVRQRGPRAAARFARASSKPRSAVRQRVPAGVNGPHSLAQRVAGGARWHRPAPDLRRSDRWRRIRDPRRPPPRVGGSSPRGAHDQRNGGLTHRDQRAAALCPPGLRQTRTAASQAPAASTVADSSMTIDKPIARSASRVACQAAAWGPSRRRSSR